MGILHNLSSSGGGCAATNFLTDMTLTDEPMSGSSGAGTFAVSTYLGITYIADVVGVAGNNIIIAYDGIIDSSTGVANWNGANPGNTATMDDTKYIHPLGSVTLAGGVDVVNDFILEAVSGITFTADNPGAAGITLGTGAPAFVDGINDGATIVANWNAAFPGNTISITSGSPIGTPPAVPLTLVGNAPGVAATAQHDGVDYLADFLGAAGNSIVLNFDGVDDNRTDQLANWNAGNPGNTAAITAENIIPPAFSVIFSGGSSSITGIVTPSAASEGWCRFSLQISWKDGVGTTGGMTVEVSNTGQGDSFVPLDGLDNIALSTNSGKEFFDISYINFKFWRYSFTSTGGTGGLMSVVLNVRV